MDAECACEASPALKGYIQIVVHHSARTTQTRLKPFELEELVRPDAIRVIKDGVVEGEDFLLKE